MSPAQAHGQRSQWSRERCWARLGAPKSWWFAQGCPGLASGASLAGGCQLAMGRRAGKKLWYGEGFLGCLDPCVSLSGPQNHFEKFWDSVFIDEEETRGRWLTSKLTQRDSSWWHASCFSPALSFCMCVQRVALERGVIK